MLQRTKEVMLTEKKSMMKFTDWLFVGRHPPLSLVNVEFALRFVKTLDVLSCSGGILGSLGYFKSYELWLAPARQMELPPCSPHVYVPFSLPSFPPSILLSSTHRHTHTHTLSCTMSHYDALHWVLSAHLRCLKCPT